MIWTIKIQLVFGFRAEEDWESTIEVESNSTLEDIHYIAQSAVEFDNDHMYEFYVSRTERSRNKIRYNDENEKIYNTTLEDLFPLEKDRNLYYKYDFGDNWQFKISKTRIKPFEAVKGKEYPILINEKGKPPEQYPDWD